jgi:hypothetical protein
MESPWRHRGETFIIQSLKTNQRLKANSCFGPFDITRRLVKNSQILRSFVNFVIMKPLAKKKDFPVNISQRKNRENESKKEEAHKTLKAK